MTREISYHTKTCHDHSQGSSLLDLARTSNNSVVFSRKSEVVNDGQHIILSKCTPIERAAHDWHMAKSRLSDGILPYKMWRMG